MIQQLRVINLLSHTMKIQILMKKKQPVKGKILPAFLLIAIALLIAVSIYCYFIKHRAKQKHLLPFQFTNNELKKIIY